MRRQYSTAHAGREPEHPRADGGDRDFAKEDDRENGDEEGGDGTPLEDVDRGVQHEPDAARADPARKRGVYRHPRNWRVLWVTSSNGVLKLSSERAPGPGSGLVLKALSDGTFRGAGETTTVAFDDTGMTIRQPIGVEQRFERAMAPACQDTFTDDKTNYVFTRGHRGKVEGVTLSLARVRTAHIWP